MSLPPSLTAAIAGFFGLVPLYFARFYLVLFNDSVQTRYIVEAVSFHVVLGLLLTYRRPDDSEILKQPDPKAEDVGRDKETAGRLVLIDCILWFVGIPATVSAHSAVIVACIAGAVTVILSGPSWLNLPGWKGTRFPVRESFKQD